MSEEKKTGKVFDAVRQVMSKIGSIGKNHRNTFQNYSFVSVGDVMAALQPLLVENSLVLQPQYTIEQFNPLEKGYAATVNLHLGIWHTEDGSGITVGAIGQGADAGDKAASKAMAMAFKYAIRQTFCIPDVSEDGDAQSPDVRHPPTQKPTYTTMNQGKK